MSVPNLGTIVIRGFGQGLVSFFLDGNDGVGRCKHCVHHLFCVVSSCIVRLSSLESMIYRDFEIRNSSGASRSGSRGIGRSRQGRMLSILGSPCFVELVKPRDGEAALCAWRHGREAVCAHRVAACAALEIGYARALLA